MMNIINAFSYQDCRKLSDAEWRSGELSFPLDSPLRITDKSQFLSKMGANVCMRDPGRRASVEVPHMLFLDLLYLARAPIL